MATFIKEYKNIFKIPEIKPAEYQCKILHQISLKPLTENNVNLTLYRAVINYDSSKIKNVESFISH